MSTVKFFFDFLKTILFIYFDRERREKEQTSRGSSLAEGEGEVGSLLASIPGLWDHDLANQVPPRCGSFQWQR